MLHREHGVHADVALVARLVGALLIHVRPVDILPVQDVCALGHIKAHAPQAILHKVILVHCRHQKAS